MSPPLPSDWYVPWLFSSVFSSFLISSCILVLMHSPPVLMRSLIMHFMLQVQALFSCFLVSVCFLVPCFLVMTHARVSCSWLWIIPVCFCLSVFWPTLHTLMMIYGIVQIKHILNICSCILPHLTAHHSFENNMGLKNCTHKVYSIIFEIRIISC